MQIATLSLWGQKIKTHEIEDYPIPRNLTQCFKVLDKTMCEEEKHLIKILPEDSIIYHNSFNVGADFCHAWKIYDESRLTKYLIDRGFRDWALYETILISYHRYLNNQDIDLNGQLAKYQTILKQEKVKSSNKDDSIFLNSLIKKELISYIDYFNGYDKIRGIKETDDKYYYVCVNDFPPNFSFDDSICGVKIRYISLINYRGLEKLLKKGIHAFFLSNINLKNNRLIIGFQWQNVKLMYKNQLNFAISEFANIVYEYSCERQEWVKIESQYGGI